MTLWHYRNLFIIVSSVHIIVLPKMDSILAQQFVSIITVPVLKLIYPTCKVHDRIACSHFHP